MTDQDRNVREDELHAYEEQNGYEKGVKEPEEEHRREHAGCQPAVSRKAGACRQDSGLPEVL